MIERRRDYGGNLSPYGNVYIGAKVLMEALGVDIVPLATDKAMEIGQSVSAEFICAP